MVEPPSRERLRRISADFFAPPTEEELDVFESLAESWLADHDRVASLAADRTPVPDRSPADVEETWAVDDSGPFLSRFCLEGTSNGSLRGYSIGVKDNIAVAGVPMTCGSTAFEDFIPPRDAVAVQRLLAAGGTVIGKLNLESMAYSGSGEIADYGPVPNPRDNSYLAGGSSSGCAAAVVNGTVDLAVGTDQSGSVRVPAAWSGCVGHKPTFGLVPYTGGVSLEPTVDHIGPMAQSVADCALALEVMAGTHPSDSRQGTVPATRASNAIHTDQSLKIGILEEAFDLNVGSQVVSEKVQNALNALSAEGHTVESVSVPLHADGFAIYNAIVLESYAALVRDEGTGYYRRGNYDDTFASAFAQARRTRAREFPAAMRLSIALGRYLAENYHGRYHRYAQRVRDDLRIAYDKALAEVDVLAMPTTPQTAHKINPDLSLKRRIERSIDMFGNTAPFNLTGHPAVSVPCGSVDDLPVGLMFVGNTFDDKTVLQAARAVERSRI